MKTCGDGVTLDIKEPRNLSEALSYEYNVQWKKVTDSQFSGRIESDTRQLVSPPEDKNIVGSQWVFKVKRSADLSLEKFKHALSCPRKKPSLSLLRDLSTTQHRYILTR